MSRITFALAKGRLAKKTLEILDKLDIRPVDMTDESRKLVFNSSDDKYSFFLDNNHSLITIENLDSKNDDSILIIKDSYANAFVPLIAPSYKYIYVIDPRYYNLSISDYINEKQIDKVLFIYNVLTIDEDLGIVSIK